MMTRLAHSLRCAVVAVLLAVALPSAAPAQSGAVAPVDTVVFDATVARVNGDLIMKSDILWNLALLKTVSPSEFWDRKVQEAMLRTLIDQRLILQEATKLPLSRVTDDEIAAEIANIKADFAPTTDVGDDPNRFERRGELVGLTGPRLETIVRRRLRINKFIDFRFRSFVVVTEPEIQRYFDNEVKSSLPDQTEAALRAALDEHRAMIEKILIEEKVNESIDAYLEAARERAEVIRLDQ